MRVSGIVLAFGLALGIPTSQALEVAPVKSGTAHQALFSIDVRGEQLLAVGTGGQVLASEDGGRAWQTLQTEGTTLALLGVDQRGAHAVAVGQRGTIAVRQDGVWRAVSSPTEERLMSVGVNAEGLAVAVGAFGTVLRSVDGGQSWSQVEIEWPNLDADQMGIQPHLYDVQFGDDGTVMVVGEYAVVLRSDDGGVNWRVIHRGDASIFALKVAPGGNGYAVGQDGLILRTTDGGQSWERRETESKANLFSVQALPNGHVVVAGMREWLTSEDGGSSWTSHREDVLGTAWFTDLALSSSGRLMAVGQAGQVIEVRGE
jgi:photosystem II stability/assembly factor-like uncharacterized protein